MKTKIFVATCLAFSVISSSCSDFLTEDPKGQMVQNNYFSSQNDLDGAVSVFICTGTIFSGRSTCFVS